MWIMLTYGLQSAAAPVIDLMTTRAHLESDVAVRDMNRLLVRRNLSAA
jgi:hypothetical protein